MKTIVSIVTCIKDERQRLEQTIASIRESGDIDGVEYVIKDASADSAFAADQAAGLARTLKDATVVFHSSRDGGIYDGMNQAARVATGRFINYLNAGDLLGDRPDVEGVVAALGDVEAEWAFARVRYNPSHRTDTPISKTIPFNRRDFLLGRQDFNHQACFVAKDYLLRSGGFSLNFGLVGDYQLMLRLIQTSMPAEIDRVFAVYEGGGVSALKAHELPMQMHRARASVYRSPAARAASWIFSQVQTVRRDRIRNRSRARDLGSSA